jgi:NAD(P)-dependent dehydrogenase (short-subunit alcohol dehydrogenase family)
MINPMQLTNKKILVTGASSGIGKETSILLSKLGAKVIMLARREEKLKETLAALEGEGHKYYSFDLHDIEGIENMVKRIISENGPIDGFVHSAGISELRPIAMTKPNFLHKIMLVNFYSFIELCRCLTKRKNFNEQGSIVAVSSVAAQQGEKGKLAYSASKAALDAAVRCIAKELAEKKIRVNTIALSRIDTDMNKTLKRIVENQDYETNVLNRQYLGLGKPIDAANMIAYLLSDAAKFITGTSIAVDGGRLSS